MTFETRTLSIIALSLAITGPVPAQAADSPYGTARFAPHSDIENLKELKVVWDFNFIDPKALGIGLGNLNSLLRTATEIGPRGSDALKVVVVSHGPELVVFDKQNYAKYKDLVDRAASLAKQGVRFEVCRSAARAIGLTPEDFHGFITVVPNGPYALAYWQSKGYTLNAVGATMPTRSRSDLNKDDIRKK